MSTWAFPVGGKLLISWRWCWGPQSFATLKPIHRASSTRSVQSVCCASPFLSRLWGARKTTEDSGMSEIVPGGMMDLKPQPFKLILGSSSASRRQILQEMGYRFTLMSADIDEKDIRREKPEDLVMALAEAKADAIISRLQISDYENDIEPTLLITADQVVVHEGVIREKPSSKIEARLFIESYSRNHTATIGSVLVTNLKTGIRKGCWDKAEIYFHEIPHKVQEELIEEGVVLHVAGGLLIEHPLISPFIEAVVGTVDSLMGLPKELTEKLIQEAL